MSYHTLLKTSAMTALLAVGAGAANADFVILDDLIVDGSACIGFDCVNGESFGFDTIRLKENNLRIKFEDTSSAANFPTTDWQLVANDSANGGLNKFSILDSTANRTIFTVEGNAPSNSLYVDDGGRVGFGTSIPVADLHVKTGNTPTLRLEQDGTSGFAPQTWDVAGNETNFFIRDASNGSTLPFRIRPGAPTSSIIIDTEGQVGLGTGTNPSSLLHLRRGGAGNDGLPRITLENTDADVTWIIDGNDADFFRISVDGSGQQEMQLDDSGNLTITGEITTSGSCSVGCDRVFDVDYALPTITEHGTMMFENGYLPNVGPTAEDGPFNMSDKVLRMLNELEHAHIYIQQLNERIITLEEELASR